MSSVINAMVIFNINGSLSKSLSSRATVAWGLLNEHITGVCELRYLDLIAEMYLGLF